MNPDQEQWMALGAKPIKADAPAGESARYDVSYESLQAEIQKLDGLSKQPVDWKEVVNLSRTILQVKSKDLLVAGYLSLGLFEQNRYEGLLNGLSCIDGMVRQYWENLFPEAKRMRARINAIFWLAQKAGAAVGRKAPEAGEKEIFLACLNQVEMLEKLLGEKLGNDSPGLGDLRRALQEHQRTFDSVVEKPEGEKREEEKKPQGGSAPVSPEVSSEIKTVDDVKPALRESKERIFRAAIFLQNHDPVQPWPYRSIRALAWLEIDTLPAGENGLTRVPPPDANFLQIVKNLTERGAWTEQIKQVESRFKEFPLWLDLNRYSVQAMTRLGRSYQKAAGAITSELSKLLFRLPRLMDLQFSDGMPFADDPTKKWIETEVVSTPSTGPENERSQPLRTSGKLPDLLAELREKAGILIGNGQLKEAVGVFHKTITESPSRQIQFLIRLELAKLCLESDQPRIAVSHLGLLDQQIKQYSLEEWDPQLCVQVFLVYWQTLGRILQETKQGPVELAREAETVYRSLYRLDPMTAMDLDQKKKTGWFGR